LPRHTREASFLLKDKVAGTTASLNGFATRIETLISRVDARTDDGKKSSQDNSVVRNEGREKKDCIMIRKKGGTGGKTG